MNETTSLPAQFGECLPGVLAAVWAEANTRADIFDALQRREAFATSGSRIQVRFFAGQYDENMGAHEDTLATAYGNGVPMGSDMTNLEDASFWVWASQDPNAPALDRIQVIKGWLEDGEEKQKVWGRRMRRRSRSRRGRQMPCHYCLRRY